MLQDRARPFGFAAPQIDEREGLQRVEREAARAVRHGILRRPHAPGFGPAGLTGGFAGAAFGDRLGLVEAALIGVDLVEAVIDGERVRRRFQRLPEHPVGGRLVVPIGDDAFLQQRVDGIGQRAEIDSVAVGERTRQAHFSMSSGTIGSSRRPRTTSTLKRTPSIVRGLGITPAAPAARLAFAVGLSALSAIRTT